MNDSFSVIVPVFNKETRLAACISSVVGQLGACDELILVDDGSTDDSPGIAKRAASTYSQVTYLPQNNSGVSAARNAGMAAAHGDWYLFVDADDALEAGSISALHSFVDDFGGEVDVVTYPIRYEKPDGSTRRHKREKWLKETGVYSLDSYSQIAQSTMNVLVRSRDTDEIGFETGREMGEDQLYVTRNLVRRAAIGFCKEAEYRYSRDGSGRSYHRNSPLYTFEEYLHLTQAYVDLAGEHPNMADYAYHLALYNIGWRTRQDSLLPEFGSDDLRERNLNRLACLMRQIPLRIWLKSVYIRGLHKPYLIETFHLFDGVPSVSFNSKKTVFDFDGNRWKTARPSLHINRIVVGEEALQLHCVLFSAAFWYDSRPTIQCEVDGNSATVAYRESSYSYYASHSETTRAFAFDLQLPLPHAGEAATAALSVRIAGCDVPSLKWTIKPKRSNLISFDAGLRWRCRGLEVAFSPDENSVRLKGMRFFTDREYEDFLGLDQNSVEQRIALSDSIKQLRSGDVWLYVGRYPGSEDDGVFAQFVHDRAKDDGIQRFFATDSSPVVKSGRDSSKVRLVRLGDPSYMGLFLAADVVVTDAEEVADVFPPAFTNGCSVSDLCKKKHIVHLRADVCNEHAPWKRGADRTSFDACIVLTRAEARAAEAEYDYDASRIIDLGFPLCTEALGENAAQRVLIALNWRSYLVQKTAAGYVCGEYDIRQSAYGRGLKALVDALVAAGIPTSVLIHPNLTCYRAGLQQWLLGARVVDDAETSDFGVVVTDFCPQAYRLALRGAHLVGYIPDTDELRSHLNYCQGFDFDFPIPCSTVEEVVESVSSALSKKVALRADREFRDSMRGKTYDALSAWVSDQK